MQIFLKIFSRLRIFYIGVCGKIIRWFEEILFGDLMFRVPNVNQAEGCLRLGERSISEYLLPKKVLGTYTRIMSANGNPIFQRAHGITSRYKKILLMLYVETGVWHNPRIIKQKQYIPKYALTLANLIRFLKLPDFIHNDWFVSNNMLCSRARNNQPLLIACKSIKIFQHIQIFMKKIFVFYPFKAKN